ncbi:hypothetical protein IHE45_18G001900 [Dioscorea alata]|uniref:Uncharacterized protein n=4 Tax=Dioscorea alata TaxID=55571 RepID=A0ACB7U4T1_DIOAL|nr:hypothetical protein IHE45_18G001900 [Dioscorea alata]KAH7655314.1 hypothetical protein IHE45_18G001900 [Dioscorea alata]KAH7655315.1 hypothetical protein IHE45_18G001900 [Dioscorea alata]KAH7655316.1 hypothetical protein IHE45_18G001900 [Dioscorea alata]
MKNSPVFPKDETANGNAVRCDTEDGFSKFLEEARKHANDVILNSAKPSSNSVENIIRGESTKASKKSWKNIWLFWRKPGKMNNAGDDRSLKTTKKKNNSLSHAHAGKDNVGGGGRGPRMSRPKSGPLSSCFTPTRAEETEVPYMCLDQPDYPHSVLHNHGPIYKVT